MDGSWIDYKSSTEKCGKDVLKKYLRDHKLNNVYGKASTNLSTKRREELESNKMKKKRNEIRSTLNKRKSRNELKSKKSKSTTSNIIDHELTAAGTFYTIRKDDGETEVINHRTLIKTHPTQVKIYQDQVQNKKKQLRLRGKQIRGKRVKTYDKSSQKNDSMEKAIFRFSVLR